MARKKIVLVIVEGPSDDSALGVILNRLFDKNFVHTDSSRRLIKEHDLPQVVFHSIFEKIKQNRTIYTILSIKIERFIFV